MRTIACCFDLAALLLICVIGVGASLLGLHRLDAWCARQLTDTDGQPET